MKLEAKLLPYEESRDVQVTLPHSLKAMSLDLDGDGHVKFLKLLKLQTELQLELFCM